MAGEIRTPKRLKEREASAPRAGWRTPPYIDYRPDPEQWDCAALAEVARAHGLDLIVLFGSTAKAKRRVGSDLDVAMHFAEPRDRPVTWEEESRAASAIEDVLRPRCELDVVRLNGASPLLQGNVAREGVPLFALNDAAWTRFRIRACRQFEDGARLRRLRWQVFLRRLHGMRPRRDELQEKLMALAGYADELEAWLTAPPEPRGPRGLQRIAERLLQVLIECAADAGDLWLADRGLALGESVRGVFQRLEEEGILDSALARRFEEYVRTRKRIVHDYDRLDDQTVLEQANRLPADVRTLLRGLTAPGSGPSG